MCEGQAKSINSKKSGNFTASNKQQHNNILSTRPTFKNIKGIVFDPEPKRNRIIVHSHVRLLCITIHPLRMTAFLKMIPIDPNTILILGGLERDTLMRLIHILIDGEDCHDCSFLHCWCQWLIGWYHLCFCWARQNGRTKMSWPGIAWGCSIIDPKFGWVIHQAFGFRSFKAVPNSTAVALNLFVCRSYIFWRISIASLIFFSFSFWVARFFLWYSRIYSVLLVVISLEKQDVFLYIVSTT